MHAPKITEAQKLAREAQQKATGARLRRLREALGLTQTQAAAQSGISNFKLNHMEAGRYPIDMLALQTFCEAHHIGADYVVVASALALPAPLRDKIQLLEDQEMSRAREGIPPENLAADIRARSAALATSETPPDHPQKKKRKRLPTFLAVVA